MKYAAINTNETEAISSCYIHIPYCETKCPYCDFNSIAGRDDEHNHYIDALIADIKTLPPGPYDTIFMGGGTPTLLSPQLLERLLNTVQDHLQFTDNYEFTCEANPGSVDRERFESLKQGGVNRISLGIQAMRDDQLQFLGRVHNKIAAEKALDLACQLFPRVSADLIIGLPEQNQQQLLETLDIYKRFALSHASVYHLTIEPGTEFYARHNKGETLNSSPEIGASLLQEARAYLAHLGLHAYETSNFAKKDQACRHNLAYWEQKDYVAAGAGAVSTINGLRETRQKHPEKYIQAIQSGKNLIWKKESLSHTEIIQEAWMLGLRLRRGVSRKRLQQLQDPESRWLNLAQHFAQSGHLEMNDSHIALTEKSYELQDYITGRLMPD